MEFLKVVCSLVLLAGVVGVFIPILCEKSKTTIIVSFVVVIGLSYLGIATGMSELCLMALGFVVGMNFGFLLRKSTFISTGIRGGFTFTKKLFVK